VINVVISLFIKKPSLIHQGVEFPLQSTESTPKHLLKIEQPSNNFRRRLVQTAEHYKSIVVAVDGSQEAEYAFRKSIDVVKRNENSILNIVNVIDTRSFEAYDRSIVEHASSHQKDF